MKLSTVPRSAPEQPDLLKSSGWLSWFWLCLAIVYSSVMLYLYWSLSASFERDERFYRWQSFCQEAEEASSAGHGSQALQLYTKALTEARQGDLAAAKISTLGSLARSYLVDGKPKQAAAALKDRVGLVRDVYGADGPEMYYALADFADSCKLSGDLPAAISGYKIAYQLLNQNDRLPFAERTTLLRNFASALTEHGEVDEAKNLSLELADLPQPAIAKLPIHNLSRDRRSPYLRDWEKLVQLAKTEATGTQMEAAKAHYRQALELIPKFYAGEDAGNQRSVATIACLVAIYQQQNNYDDAAGTFGEFLKQYDAAVGVEDDCVANASREYAVGLWRKKLYPEAIAALNRTLRIQDSAKIKDEASISWTLHLLGIIADEAGKKEEADKAFDRAVKLREKLFKPDDRGLADTILASGFLKQRMGKDKEAVVLLRKALSIYKKRGDMKVSHPGTSCLISIAQIQRGQCQYVKAEQTFTEVLKRNQHFFGLHSLENGGVFGELGYIQLCTKRPRDAIVSLNQGIEIFKKYHRPVDLGAIAVYYMWIGHARCNLREYAEGRDAYLKGLQIGKYCLSKDSPQMKEMAAALATVDSRLAGSRQKN